MEYPYVFPQNLVCTSVTIIGTRNGDSDVLRNIGDRRNRNSLLLALAIDRDHGIRTDECTVHAASAVILDEHGIVIALLVDPGGKHQTLLGTGVDAELATFACVDIKMNCSVCDPWSPYK